METRKASWKKQGINITLNEYNQKAVNQTNCCAICKKPQNKLTRKLAVDHNHNTHQVRGLLCTHCNLVILPIVENHLNVIENAQVYLKLHHKKTLRRTEHLIQRQITAKPFFEAAFRRFFTDLDNQPINLTPLIPKSFVNGAIEHRFT